MCHFQAQNGPFVLNKFFFGTNHYYYFHLPIGPSHCAKFKKNSFSRSRVMRMCHFLIQNGPFAPPQFFFSKIINIILIYLLGFFVVQNFKKILQADPELWGCAIFGLKMVNEPCFFHSCLSTCQKSKTNINLLLKYWRLKNTEISLAESHFRL